MGRALGFVGIIITLAIGMYVYSSQIKKMAPGVESGPSAPKVIINLQGVKNDLLQFCKAEQQHLASDGHYVSLSDLHSDTGIPPDSRGPFNYDIDLKETTFTVTATYQGDPPAGVPHTMTTGPGCSISNSD